MNGEEPYMRIYTHAVANYVERILNHDPRHVGSGVKRFAREQIEKTVTDPDRIHHRENTKDKEMRDCPIYIRQGVAVPLDWDENGPFVPTTYRAERFPRGNGQKNEPAKQ